MTTKEQKAKNLRSVNKFRSGINIHPLYTYLDNTTGSWNTICELKEFGISKKNAVNLMLSHGGFAHIDCPEFVALRVLWLEELRIMIDYLASLIYPLKRTQKVRPISKEITRRDLDTIHVVLQRAISMSKLLEMSIDQLVVLVNDEVEKQEYIRRVKREAHKASCRAKREGKL